MVSKVLSKAWGLGKNRKVGVAIWERFPIESGKGGVQIRKISKFILQLFRWVEYQKVSKRIVEIWPSVIRIMNHWMSLPPTKQPKCKSYEVVKGAIKDPFTVAKLKFFSFISGLRKLNLTIFQSQKPLILCLYDDLQWLIWANN